MLEMDSKHKAEFDALYDYFMTARNIRDAGLLERVRLWWNADVRNLPFWRGVKIFYRYMNRVGSSHKEAAHED